MEMILKKKESEELIESIGQDSTWEELAEIINFATTLQGKAVEVAIHKGLSEELTEGEIIEKLRDAGCTLGNAHLYRLVDFHSFKIDLSLIRAHDSNLKIPETEAQYGALEGGSALEKAELYTDLSKDKQATRDEVRAAKTIIKEAEEAARLARKKAVAVSTDMPKYLSTEQMESFDEWFISKTGKTRQEVKPKVDLKKIMENRGLIIETFRTKVSDWPKARKILLNATHPDKGGDPVAFQFIETLDKLMKEMIKLMEYGKYRLKIQTYKNAWWKEYTK